MRKIIDKEVLKNKCNDNTVIDFIDVIYPISYRKNKINFDVNVGKQFDKDKFYVFLSSFTSEFSVCFKEFKDSIYIIFKDCLHNNRIIFAVNISSISNVNVDCDSIEDCFTYNIDFDYKENLHYHICVKNM